MQCQIVKHVQLILFVLNAEVDSSHQPLEQLVVQCKTVKPVLLTMYVLNVLQDYYQTLLDLNVSHVLWQIAQLVQLMESVVLAQQVSSHLQTGLHAALCKIVKLVQQIMFVLNVQLDISHQLQELVVVQCKIARLAQPIMFALNVPILMLFKVMEHLVDALIRVIKLSIVYVLVLQEQFLTTLTVMLVLWPYVHLVNKTTFAQHANLHLSQPITVQPVAVQPDTFNQATTASAQQAKYNPTTHAYLAQSKTACCVQQQQHANNAKHPGWYHPIKHRVFVVKIVLHLEATVTVLLIILNSTIYAIFVPYLIVFHAPKIISVKLVLVLLL